MESVPKGVRKDRNENEEHADLEEKTALKLAKEKQVTFKALSGKRKDKKADIFLWTRYLQVIIFSKKKEIHFNDFFVTKFKLTPFFRTVETSVQKLTI